MLFGARSVLFPRHQPILGTIILTDDCNLKCQHCAVSNISRVHHPYADIHKEMVSFYREGIRILFFCGGETLLWRDGERTVRHLIREAKALGFYIVNVVTNGTLDLNIAEADLIFLSLDGTQSTHDAIRGNVYDRILRNLCEASRKNICVYMAINRLNCLDIKPVAQLARDHPRIRCVSFNFHTPYPGTEHLALSGDQKAAAVAAILDLIKENYPVFNLASSLKEYLKNRWSRPCHQCLVSEAGKRFVCGRCVEIEGLCAQCGYLFAIEFSLLFSGHLPTLIEVLRTYPKYV
jgi:Fe-coproporphyrin III synthase